MNVHHIPVCTSFYFIDGVHSTKPVVDATAKEEKLSKSRLSICMNIFEDLCGMTTLGSLEVNPKTLLDCTKTALILTKDLTRRVREAYSQRAAFTLLDFSLSSSAQAIAQANQTSANTFLESFFKSQEPDQDLQATESVKEQEIVDILHRKAQNGNGKASKQKAQKESSIKPENKPSPLEEERQSEEQQSKRLDKLKSKEKKL